jgi:thymidylate kinase
MKAARGRLIAVDGSGASLGAAAKTLTAALRREREGSGTSSWDSSGIFTELECEDAEDLPSARTLTLLYAADLAFRVRWQIRPALDAGLSVVAAPYVETAKSLAISAGLPRKWVQELFRFAPRPDASYHALDRTLRVRGRANGDYLERFLDTCAAAPHRFDPGQLRKQSAAYLIALEKKGRCRRFK